MSRWRVLVALVLMGLVAAVRAQPGDPLKSEACTAAIAALEQARAARADAPRNPDQPDQAVETLRRQAAQICLGRATRETTRSSMPLPSVATPATRWPEAPQVQGGPAPPPLALPRDPVITACDPAGCWDSSGRRLNQMGPVLVGPGGPCTVHAGVTVTCP